MLKSDLIQRILAQNPHLYHRDIEKLINTILDEIVDALHRGERGATGLRSAFGQAPAAAQGAQSQDRR